MRGHAQHSMGTSMRCMLRYSRTAWTDNSKIGAPNMTASTRVTRICRKSPAATRAATAVAIASFARRED
eukprot:14430663-Alexandrium_andersonii.AAC.1